MLVGPTSFRTGRALLMRPDTSHVNTEAERIAFIGDVGGHISAFVRTLDYLEVDPETLRIPEKLAIVQVGDLVHKGAYSQECVDLAARLIDANPSQFVQLVGNHEAHYLGGPDVTGRNGVNAVTEYTRQMLCDWWADGTLRIACSATTSMGPVLISHGGLTIGFHHELGDPSTPAGTVEALESLRGDKAPLFRPGKLMTGRPDTCASVICPRTGVELYGPWLSHGSIPYSQIHGHESVWWWPTDTWHDDVPLKVRYETVVDKVSRQSWLDIAGQRLWCIDPGYGVEEPKLVPFPLVLPGRLDT